MVPQTFTFSSAIHGAPNLTSWDSFQPTTILSGGSQTFGIRSATFQFTNSSTYTYTNVTAGSIPSVAISTWFQINDFFSVTSTNQLVLNDFTQNWFEGNATDKLVLRLLQIIELLFTICSIKDGYFMTCLPMGST